MHSAMTLLNMVAGHSLGTQHWAAATGSPVMTLPLRVAALAVHMHHAAGFLLHILSRRLRPAVVPPPPG